MAAMDRDQLMRDIREGLRLRPTKTIDKSRPVLLVEGEKLKTIAQTVAVEQKFSHGPPAPPPPPPPPPSSVLTNGSWSATLPKSTKSARSNANPLGKRMADGAPLDRDALMLAIRQGVTLRKVKCASEKPSDSGLRDKRICHKQPEQQQFADENRQMHCRGVDFCLTQKPILQNERRQFVEKCNEDTVDAVQLAPVAYMPANPAMDYVMSRTYYANGSNPIQPTYHAPYKTLSRPDDLGIVTGPQTVSNGHSPVTMHSPVHTRTHDHKQSDFVLNGIVNDVKAVWEKRNSLDRTEPSAPATKSPVAPLRLFNGPDFPEPPLPASEPPALSPTAPIAVDTSTSPTRANVPVLMKKFSCDDLLAHERDPMQNTLRKVSKSDTHDFLPKVDHLRRAYEKQTDDRLTSKKTSHCHQQQQAHQTLQQHMASNGIKHQRSESLGDAEFATHRAASNRLTKFLPDVGALKQRFEAKPEPNGQQHQQLRRPSNHQQSSVTSVQSAVSSGYSSKSPSPKCSDKHNGRFQFAQGAQGQTKDGPDTVSAMPAYTYQERRAAGAPSAKGSQVAQNKHADNIGPFKANVGTLGHVPKTDVNSNHVPNETSTWRVKKGSLPGVVSKYSVCEHLETLHQRKLHTANGMSENGAHDEPPRANRIKFDDSVDGDVARLLGIPFEQLKDFRFAIDVNDPEGSLLKIQKRYNQIA